MPEGYLRAHGRVNRRTFIACEPGDAKTPDEGVDRTCDARAQAPVQLVPSPPGHIVSRPLEDSLLRLLHGPAWDAILGA